MASKAQTPGAGEVTSIDTSFTAITVLYTNWRNETAVRRIVPGVIWFGSTEWHPERQWFLTADEPDNGKRRDFAFAGFKAWGQEAVAAALAALAAQAPKQGGAGDDLRAALAPFADAWRACQDLGEQGAGYVQDNQDAWVSGNRNGGAYPLFKFGDLRRASEALAAAPNPPAGEAVGGEIDHENDGSLAYALEQRDYWSCQVRHLQGPIAEPADALAAEPNDYIKSLLTYAEIVARYDLHVEAAGMRDVAKRLREVEDRLVRYQTSELHVDADGPWSSDLKWNHKLAAWLLWFADKQLTEERNYGARNRLRWAAEALVKDINSSAPTPQTDDLAGLSAGASPGRLCVQAYDPEYAWDGGIAIIARDDEIPDDVTPTNGIVLSAPLWPTELPRDGSYGEPQRAQANAEYVKALWNAHRSGRLVPAPAAPQANSGGPDGCPD